MENLIRELKQAIENFNLYLKNEYTTINNKIQGISNDISDYSVFTLSQPKAKDLKINLTFPRATYVMAVIKNATSSTYVELSINQPTKEKLKFYDGSFHKGIIRDLYLSYDFSNLEIMPEVKIYVGYNSTFNPITSVRLADVTSENPLPVNIIGDTTDTTNKFLNMLTKQVLVLVQEKAKYNNEKTLEIKATPSNAQIDVTYDGKTYSSIGYFIANLPEDTDVNYSVSLENYQTQTGSVAMSDNQSLDVTIYEPRTLQIICNEPITNVAIDVTVNGITTTYNTNNTGVINLHKDDNVHYKIYDTNTYDNSVIGADGYATFEDDIILTEDTVIEKSLTASYTISIDLSGQNLPYGSDTITIQDSSNNVISGATVKVRDTNNVLINTYISDNNGQVVISELAQSYNIEITKAGFTTYTGTITISQNSDTSETITLS